MSRELLRHSLATVAYRGGKTLRDVPPGFSTCRAAPGSRSAGEILAHMGDLLDWTMSLVRGAQAWDRLRARAMGPGRRQIFQRAGGVRRGARLRLADRDAGRTALSGTRGRPADPHRADRLVAPSGRGPRSRRELSPCRYHCRTGEPEPAAAPSRVRLDRDNRRCKCSRDRLYETTVAGVSCPVGWRWALRSVRSLRSRPLPLGLPIPIAGRSWRRRSRRCRRCFRITPGPHVPGAAWGVIVDGRARAHRRDRLRDVAGEGAGRRRHRVPHRLDDQELHRDRRS